MVLDGVDCVAPLGLSFHVRRLPGVYTPGDSLSLLRSLGQWTLGESLALPEATRRLVDRGVDQRNALLVAAPFKGRVEPGVENLDGLSLRHHPLADRKAV